MKKITLIISSLFFIFSSLQSQEQGTYELAINHEGPGKIVLSNGEELSGEIKYTLRENHRLFLIQNRDEKPKKYTSKDVKSFNIRDLHFTKIKGPALETFGRIKNGVDSKIQIIELIHQGMSIIPSEDGDKHKTTRTFYVLFTKHEKLIDISDMRLTNKKIASLIEDCSELSKKVASKKGEYKIGFMTSNDGKLKILKAIAEEYQNCN
jgi:hypothetical protein